MIEIQNRGQALVSTNYWDTPHAQAGYCYLSWNAGAARLLIPDNQKVIIREMKGATEVIVSRGPWRDQGERMGIELLWEDGSDAPFCLHLVEEQCDRVIPSSDQGGGFPVIIWTRGGEKGRWPDRYRIVTEIPWLKPWNEH